MTNHDKVLSVPVKIHFRPKYYFLWQIKTKSQLNGELPEDDSKIYFAMESWNVQIFRNLTLQKVVHVKEDFYL